MSKPPITPRPYHMASKITEQGDVSALCFDQPRPIDLTQACWTIRPEAVTCPGCQQKLRERN